VFNARAPISSLKIEMIEMLLRKMKRLLDLDARDLTIQKIFKMCDASWIYKKECGGPHATLTSGNHSDAYFNLNAVAMFPNFCEFIASAFVEKLAKFGIVKKDIDVVLTSTFAATSFGQEIAKALQALFVFTEKKNKDQVWTGRFELPFGSKMLHFEELITTMSTTKKVDNAVSELSTRVIEYNGKKVIGTIVHRPNSLPVNYPCYWIIPLIEMEVHNWKPSECPLCETGSEPLRPKENWAKFMKHQ